MKVVLAIAPWSHSETYPPSQGQSNIISGKFGMLGGATPPLSLLYLSSSLKEAGHETLFVDGFFVESPDFEQQVLAFDPDLVGFWCSQFSWERTKAMTTTLKRLRPSVRIVIGGTFVTAYGNRTFEDADSKDVDLIVTGDGEVTIVEICDAMAGKRAWGDILGLLWRDGDKVIANEKRPFQEHLEDIPFPDYSLLDIADYRPAIGSFKSLPSVNMMTVRGCAATCSFCHAANSLRERSVDNVIEEIRWLQSRWGVRHLLFFDETFTGERERVVEFCRKIKEAGIRIQWTCNSRVDTIDPPLLELLKDAGCWRLQFGAESGVLKQLDTIEKGVTPEQNRHGLLMAKRAGLEVFASFMLGIPGETYEEGLQTIDFAVNLPIDYVNFLNFQPLVGTQFYEELDKHGRMVGPTAFHLIAFVPHSMTHEELADLMVQSVRRYYLRPSYMVRRFLAQRSLSDVRRNVRGLMAFIGMDARKDYLDVRGDD